MLSWRRSYVHVRSGTGAATMAALYPMCSPDERRLNREFFRRYLAGGGTGGQTAIRGIDEGPGIFAGARHTAEDGDLAGRLVTEMADECSDVAVSGGTDSWLLAALLKARGQRVRGWYLESRIPGYCEREQVLTMADALGVECCCLRVSADQFVEALPAFVAHTESPIYNLHPVSKWLLARELARRGVTSIISGDGADQVLRCEWDCDLLPLTLTCFQAAGVRLIAPFLSESVVALCRVPSPQKALVRHLARRLGVPETAKRPTLFPPIAGLAVAHRSTRLLLKSLQERTLCAASPG
jgi:hypothetical protein